MTIFEATKNCFSKYYTFSGRASRPEFWKFVLFMLLASIVLTLTNSAIFGPTISQDISIRIDQATGEQTQHLATSYVYNAGWLGTIFSLLVFVPWLAVAWRRMHDSGRTGLFCLLPVAAGVISFAIFYFTSAEIPIDSTGFPEDLDMPLTMRMPQSVPAFLVAWFIAFSSFVVVLWLLCRRSTAGENRYGPNPNEVTS